MPIKVGKATISANETSVELDLFSRLKDVTPDQKQTIQSEVADFLVEQTLNAVAEEKSPIAGGDWKKKLSKDYAKIKKKEIGNTKSDIQFSGRTLDQLKAEPTNDGIKIGVFGERAPVADGHNNLSGKSTLPTRQFLPKEGQDYKKTIEREVDRIISDVLAEPTPGSPTTSTSTSSNNQNDNGPASRFEGVDTQTELYQTLREIFGPMSKIELRLAVFRNKSVLDDIVNSDLLDLL